MNQVWLDIKTVASLGLPIRTVQRNCLLGIYTTRKVRSAGKNGLKYEVLLDSLPDDVVNKFFETPKSPEEMIKSCIRCQTKRHLTSLNLHSNILNHGKIIICSYCAEQFVFGPNKKRLVIEIYGEKFNANFLNEKSEVGLPIRGENG